MKAKVGRGSSTKRPRGSGGVRFRKKEGVWEVYYRPRSGAKPVYERAGHDEAAAWRLLDKRLAERHERTEEAIRGVSYETVALEFLESKNGLVRESTYEKYEHTIRYHLIPAFGDDLIADLTARQWRQWQARKLAGDPDIPVGPDDEDVTPRQLKVATMRSHMRVARAIYRQAVADKLVDESPLDHIPTLPLERPDIRPLTVEEGRLLLDQLDPREMVLTALMLHLGLRRGEAFALKWSDYDESTRVLHVQRTMTRQKNGRFTTGPAKTRGSNRRLKLSEGLHAILMAHKAAIAAIRNPQRLVFPTKDGRHRQFTTYRTRCFIPAVIDMRLKTLAPDQLDELLTHVPFELHLVVRLAALPELRGLQLSDLLKLRWRHYDLPSRTLHFTDTRGRRRAETLPTELHDDLCATRRPAGADWLFAGRRHMHLTRPVVLDAVIAAAAEMELWRPLRIHDMRHSYASQSIAAGTNIKLLSHRLGHSSEAFTLAVYGHLYDAQLDADADTFEL